MKCVRYLVLVVTTLYLPIVSFGAEEEGDSAKSVETIGVKKSQTAEKLPENPTPKIKQDVQNAPVAQKKSVKTSKQGDVFRPSEEISEDFAVSFPVDI